MSALWWLTGFIVGTFEWYLYNDFMGKTLHSKKVKAPYKILVYFLASFFLLIINQYENVLGDIFVSIALMYIISRIFYKNKRSTLIINVIIFYTILAGTEYLVRAFCMLQIKYITAVGFVCINFFCLIAAFIVEKVFTLFTYKVYSPVYKKWFFIFMLLPVTYLGILAFFISNGTLFHYEQINYSSVLICVVMFLSVTICFYIMEKLITYIDENNEKALYIQKAHNDEIYYQKIKEKNEEQAIILHNIKHHIHAISQMAFSKQNNEILDYCKKYDETLNTPVTIEYTNNTTFNVIFAEKKALCEKKYIQFKHNITPVDIAFWDSLSVCEILGNLLDNAMEASEKCKGTKSLELNLSPLNENFIVLIIRNTYDHIKTDDRNNLISTKSDSSGHGYGLKYIKKLVEDKGGNVSYCYDGNIFKVTVIICKSTWNT